MPTRIKIEDEPWVYKTLVEAMPELDLLQTAKRFLVRTEMLKRQLTKRQRIIIEFIATLSHFYNKDTAVIPKLRDWEIAGISKTHAKAELERLEELRVIEWDRDFNEFQILSPNEWAVPPNVGYNLDRSKELFLLNLHHAGVDVDAMLKELIGVDNFMATSFKVVTPAHYRTITSKKGENYTMDLRQLDKKARITLSAKVRKDAQIDPDTVFKVEVKDGAIVLQPIIVTERDAKQS